ncbi:NADPH-dependent F420 reductase [Paramicrobacterium fandaimingii]|uniref:NADPH-dependent F420 reductase n=1 Tax=Paramicrobacterium fandaimingii TaxID=2708079 RepID=UPI0014214981|nr:hypothetical protein [Microbacterium fandaimingii]
MKELPADLLYDKLVLDTSNYYPSRDGRIAELDSNAKTTSELVQDWLGEAHLVKALNNILARHIPLLARPTGAPDRSALPIASNGAQAKREASAMIDQLGFDTLDAGALGDSRRFESESAGYTRVYLADPSTPDDQVMTANPGPTSAHKINVALASGTRVTVAGRVF